MAKAYELSQIRGPDTLCCPDPQTEILRTLQRKSEIEFETLLRQNIRGDLFDLDHVYDDPENKTLLEIACSLKGYSKFVSLLLQYQANVNFLNTNFGKAAIHFAVENSDLETLQLLLACKSTDINITDARGNTALHLAAAANKVAFVELLLKHSDIKVNKTNRKSQTALHVALSKNNVETIKVLLKKNDVDLDEIRDFDDRTCRDLMAGKYEKSGIQVQSKTNDQDLFPCLYRGDMKAFCAGVKANKNCVNDNDGNLTYLQYACSRGYVEAVKSLIDSGANVNSTCEKEVRTPLMIAANEGFYDILRLLTECDKIRYEPTVNRTILHAILEGLHGGVKDSYHLSANTDVKRDHFACFQYLLNTVPCHKLGINFPDTTGKTPLYYALKSGDNRFVDALLEKGAFIGHESRIRDTPLKYLDAKTLEKALNRSIVANGPYPGQEDYEIIFNYNLLTPILMENSANSNEFSIEMPNEEEYTYKVVSETRPLIEISEIPELRPLLKHPLFTSFLNLKWFTISKYFYMNLILYALFWFFLTIYIIFIYAPCISENTSEAETKKSFDPNSYMDLKKNSGLIWFVTFLLCGAVSLRELLQFSVSPFRYLVSFENWLELMLLGTTFLVLLPSKASNDVKSQIAAIAIFLSWMELLLLVGKHPRWSTNIAIFKTVSWNFLKFLAWYSFLIVGFALSFYLLFKDNPGSDGVAFFVNPVISIFKSAVMSTGEFETSSIPFSTHPGVSHVLFVLFVFLIAVVLLNLLNGLAVSDTQLIRSDAELVDIICRAKVIAHFEDLAVHNPLTPLNLCDNLSCLCCFVPMVRMYRARRKKPSTTCINLFPEVFPDRKVRVLPNNGNRIISNDTKETGDTEMSGKSCTRCQWSIDEAIMKTAKQILKDKEAGEKSQSDIDSCLRLLDEQKRKMDELDRKLTTIVSLLK